MNNLVKMALLGGISSATLSLLHFLPFPGLAFFSYFSPLPLFLLGLSGGFRPLYGAAFIATLLVFIIAGPFLGGEFFLSSALGPVILIKRALLRRKPSSGKTVWYPSSLLLRDLVVGACLVGLLALGIYLYFIQKSDPVIFINDLLKNFNLQPHSKEVNFLLTKLLPLLPGFFGISWALMMLINGALAQGLLVRFQKNLRPSPSLKELEVPKTILILFGVSLAFTLVSVGFLDLLGKNMGLILSLPFFLTGLGLVHLWLEKTLYTTAGLTFVYLLMLLFLWPIVLIIFLGVLKPWIVKT